MEIAKIIKILIQRYRVISLKAPSIITPSSIMLHDPTRSESPLVYLTPLLWRFVLLTERLRGYTPPPTSSFHPVSDIFLELSLSSQELTDVIWEF